MYIVYFLGKVKVRFRQLERIHCAASENIIAACWPSLFSVTDFYISTKCPESSSGSLNKTPLCQYAAAASEMPYSDA